jgi:hypothetical protein
MTRAEGVVLAFGTLAEAGQAAWRSESPYTVPAARDDLVGVALVPDIPDQPVLWRIEDVVESDRQLDNA